MCATYFRMTSKEKLVQHLFFAYAFIFICSLKANYIYILLNPRAINYLEIVTATIADFKTGKKINSDRFFLKSA